MHFEGKITIVVILRHQNNWKRYLAWKRGAVRKSVRDQVGRLLKCRTPMLGCHVYGWEDCDLLHVVPHSCKSAACSCCGKIRTDQWVGRLMDRILPVMHRQIVMTIPQQLRLPIQDNRRLLEAALFRAGAEALLALTKGDPAPISKAGKEWMQRHKAAKRYVPAIAIVLQTFGSDCKWNPHLHVIVSMGGLSLDGKRFVRLRDTFFVPEPALGAEWKLRVIKKFSRIAKKHNLHLRALRSRPHERVNMGKLLGFLRKFRWRVFINEAVLSAENTARYCGRYMFRPALAESRILAYDGRNVTFEFKNYRRNLHKTVRTLPVLTLIDRVVQHLPERYSSPVRYYGLFASVCKPKLERARALLAKLSRSPIKEPRAPKAVGLTWAQRRDAGGKEPRCSRCRKPLSFFGILLGPPRHIARLLNIDVHDTIEGLTPIAASRSKRWLRARSPPLTLLRPNHPA